MSTNQTPVVAAGPPEPKFIQLSNGPDGLYALDADGQVWNLQGKRWIPVPITRA